MDGITFPFSKFIIPNLKEVPVQVEKHECLAFQTMHNHGPDPEHSCPNSGNIFLEKYININKYFLLTLVTLGCFAGCETLGGGRNPPPYFFFKNH